MSVGALHVLQVLHYRFQVSHILEDLAVAVAVAVVAVEAVFEDALLRVQFIYYWVGVGLLVLRENGDLTQLGDLLEELS